jgi:hypothetical protein
LCRISLSQGSFRHQGWPGFIFRDLVLPLQSRGEGASKCSISRAGDFAGAVFDFAAYVFGPVSVFISRRARHLLLVWTGFSYTVEARPSVLAGQFLFSCFAGVTNQNSICRCDSAVAIL